MWVFGYGSLVWRPSIPYELRVTADLRGFVRRFWQGSTDHRGIPGRPGRVVTLVEDGAAPPVRGVAYRLPAPEVRTVLAALDHREKGGYDRLEVELDVPLEPPVDLPLESRSENRSESRQKSWYGRTINALVYRAHDQNPNWLGPAPLEVLVDEILRSRGPSGPNTEYVIRLDEALEQLGAIDPHVRAVADAVRARLVTLDDNPLH